MVMDAERKEFASLLEVGHSGIAGAYGHSQAFGLLANSGRRDGGLTLDAVLKWVL